ncbi:GIY-YIG nuclease family protein [Desulfonatronum thioautotrophicum]|uniref:GIY-YIG nuclease family protein n=1 Tax=Desulfonatronum thioautotrophicum TaxID=617001 RepID=UPI0012946AB3
MCIYSPVNGTVLFIIGVTSNLLKRVWEHKNNVIEGFTKKYCVHNLVYYEEHHDMNAALMREKQLKKWNRIWKIRLIEEFNPSWTDKYEELLKDAGFPSARE